jgi:formiminoglutamase
MVLPSNFSAQDLGDLPLSGNLKKDHALASTRALSALREGKLLSFGGGHDWAYPDGMAFLNWAAENRNKKSLTPNPAIDDQNLKPLIINFDAHLDLRPSPTGVVHSGHPFRKLIQESPIPFDFLEVGIQDHCNARAHLDFAEENGVEILTLKECTKLGFLDRIQAYLPRGTSPAKGAAGQKKTTQTFLRPCYLSVDIDALSQVFAPGASASYPTGLKISFVLWAISILKKHFDLRSLGIYEVSPPLDIGNITSKSAALIAYEALKT